MIDLPEPKPSSLVLPLEYGRRRASLRRRIIRAVLVTGSILLIAAAVRWRNALARPWHDARSAYWREQCAAFHPPAQQLVFEEDPARAAALLQSRDFTRCTVGSGKTAIRRRVRALERYLSVPGASPYKSYYVGLLLDRPILFCHELQRPDGTKTIVVITYDQEQGGAGRSFFRVFTCDREPFFDALVVQTWENFVFRADASTATTRPVRFFAGEPVTGDPSSCQFSYQLGEEWGRYTFTLKPDNVILRTREGPLP